MTHTTLRNIIFWELYWRSQSLADSVVATIKWTSCCDKAHITTYMWKGICCPLMAFAFCLSNWPNGNCKSLFTTLVDIYVPLYSLLGITRKNLWLSFFFSFLHCGSNNEIPRKIKYQGVKNFTLVARGIRFNPCDVTQMSSDQTSTSPDLTMYWKAHSYSLVEGGDL